MKHHCTPTLVSALVVLLLPASPLCADPTPRKLMVDTAPQSNEDLSAVSQRLRETAHQMRADLKAARARLEAQKAREEAQQKLKEDKPDLAKQAAGKKAVASSAIKEEPPRKAPAGQPKTDGRGQIHEAVPDEQADQAARERAAKALSEARQSTGDRAFAEPDPQADQAAKERAAKSPQRRQAVQRRAGIC